MEQQIFKWFYSKEWACMLMKFSKNILGIYMYLLHIKFSKYSFIVN